MRTCAWIKRDDQRPLCPKHLIPDAGRQVRDLLSPLVNDPDVSMEIGGAAALALGLVFISSQDEECVGAALQVKAHTLHCTGIEYKVLLNCI